MKLAAVLAGLALLAAQGAAGAGAPKTIGTRGAVLSISADAGNVAIHAAATSGDRTCDSGSVWAPATGKVTRFSDEGCSRQGADAHFQALTLGGSRAAWTDYDYGNHAYCIGPVTATLAAPKAKVSAVCPEEPDNEDMYVEYAGDGGLLLGRSYIQCDSSCAPDYNASYQDEVTLYTIGTGVRKLAAEPRDTKLLDVDAGRILVRDGKTKRLVVLDATGKAVGGVPVDAKAAFIDGAGRVSVPGVATLKTYDAATGRSAETCTMKAGAKVWDVENGVAAYSVRSELHLLTIESNRDLVVTTAKTLVDADLEPAGLYYAYNVPGRGAKPGRVSFIASSALPR